jgi:hypothetical protein
MVDDGVIDCDESVTGVDMVDDGVIDDDVID